eukprot:RCo022873
MTFDCLPALAHSLRGSLTTDDARLLAILSPEGIAKLNVDLDRGVDVAKTLDQVRAAYLHLKQRRATLKDRLCPRAKTLAELLPRPLTTDELALLVEGAVDEILDEITARSSSGEPLEEVLEELAAEHKHEALRQDARRCSSRMRQRVSLHTLAPTECVPGKYINSLNCLKVTRKKPCVCPSAAAAWFREKQALLQERTAPRSEDGEGVPLRSLVISPPLEPTTAAYVRTPPPQSRCPRTVQFPQIPRVTVTAPRLSVTYATASSRGQLGVISLPPAGKAVVE